VATASTFEDLLNAEFRWPRKGDEPFEAADEWSKNAYLEESAGTRLVLMTSGYKMGADMTVAVFLRALPEDAWHHAK